MGPVRRIGVLAAFLAVAAAWSGSALAAGSAPTNTELPTISGARYQVGQTLSALPGSWTDSPTSYAYQWQRCKADGSGCTDIAGATGAIYVPVGADANSMLVVVVTATNASGSGTASSLPTVVLPADALATTHFVVHYGTDPGSGAAITETQAGDIGAFAERAYAAYTAEGYPAPLSDGTLGGDSRIDIYVQNLSSLGVLGIAIPDGAGTTSSGYIDLDGSSSDGIDQHSIAHELFHLIQFAIWVPPSVTDDWLYEASAEWMGYRVDGFAGPIELGNWDMSLDCHDPYSGFECDLDAYKNGGYSRWPFFEYVFERSGWGDAFVKSIFDQGAAGAGSATAAVASAIQAKGGSLSDVFTDWTVANMTGGYTVSQLQVPPQTYGSPIVTGTASGSIPSVEVPVDHLSARYVEIDRGSGSSSGACYAATLKLSVSLPSGIGARPYFWWGAPSADGSKQPPQPLSVDGSTASITLPWDTCNWGSAKGYLDLSNPSTSVDGADFTVTGTLTVDSATQATATPPPGPVKMHGATVNAAGAIAAGEGVPQVAVFGPQVIRLAPGQRGLRIIVEANGDGKLQAALGSVVLGVASVRAGGNDLRFALPTKATASLTKKSRRRAAASDLLTLRPLSTGGASGPAVTRRVVLQPAVKTAAARR
ncbi:MAG TPA: hypothetical protein VFL66_08820 [Gaiellaceae bacterium]|nr:hypothetical protein [Gaiellaceae bacterium]